MLETMFVYGSVYLSKAKECAKEKLSEFRSQEVGGAEILATIILIAIVVLLAVAFRQQLSSIVTKIWGSISGKTDTLMQDFPSS